MRIRPVLLVLSIGLIACAPDTHGVLAAGETGTLLEPPAERGDALAWAPVACGGPTTKSDALRRLPLVQHVEDRAARLTWTSSASSPERVVVWTPSGEERELIAEDEPTRYLRGARQRTVRIDDLEPGAIHCYGLRDDEGATVFGPSAFRTAPPATMPGRVAFAVLGDSGSGSADQRAIASQLRTVPLDFLLHVGDVAYPDGTLAELESNHVRVYAELTSTLPFYPAIGDHDDATDRAGPYREVFALPGAAGVDAGERYYSFDHGPVHVAVLDALRGGAAQLAWLDRDLAASDRAFRVVVVHEPPYSSGWHGSNERLRDALAPILERHRVHLVLSGDDHHYERSTPQRGVTYVVTGGGGYSVRPVGRSAWTAFSQMVFHFVHVVIEGDEMRVHAIDGTGREFDGVVIPRSRAADR